jgi:hypothetical protein
MTSLLARPIWFIAAQTTLAVFAPPTGATIGE